MIRWENTYINGLNAAESAVIANNAWCYVTCSKDKRHTLEMRHRDLVARVSCRESKAPVQIYIVESDKKVKKSGPIHIKWFRSHVSATPKVPIKIDKIAGKDRVVWSFIVKAGKWTICLLQEIRHAVAMELVIECD